MWKGGYSGRVSVYRHFSLVYHYVFKQCMDLVVVKESYTIVSFFVSFKVKFFLQD